LFEKEKEKEKEKDVVSDSPEARPARYSLSHILTAPSPEPLTRAYPQNCTPPTKSVYISQLPSAIGGAGKLNALEAADNKPAPGKPETAKAFPRAPFRPLEADSTG
jgi:hypothetical protein